MSNPENKLTIIGGGIVGALEAYFAYVKAKKTQDKIRITIYEKNTSIEETTGYNLAPSLTPYEIALAIIPRGPEFIENLSKSFRELGGIQVDDIPELADSESAKEFIAQTKVDALNEAQSQHRTKMLIELGKVAMNLWQRMYDEADPELKQIFKESNFNPCKERLNHDDSLYNGYRIDLIYNIPQAQEKAEQIKRDYQLIGYSHCKILSPLEAVKIDPFLKDFCKSHSQIDADGNIVWKNNSTAIYRPGGCLDTEIFLPKFYDYLSKVMGKYVNEEGKIKNCFQLKFDRKVNGVIYEPDNPARLAGLTIDGRGPKQNKFPYKESNYVFCPGEAVGTLRKLGFLEPASSGFIGASLKLNIPVSAEILEKFKGLNHYMEVYYEGIILAWQARIRDNHIYIGVAGTKAFHADIPAHKDQTFATDRNLLQLNIINNVLPEVISLALGRNTFGETLTNVDLKLLEHMGLVRRWVGTRAVAFDCFPTLGPLYNEKGPVDNARVTTHLGSGGVSVAPAAVLFSRKMMLSPRRELQERLMHLSGAHRKARAAL